MQWAVDTCRSVVFFFYLWGLGMEFRLLGLEASPLLSEWSCQPGFSFDQSCQWSSKDTFLFWLLFYMFWFCGQGGVESNMCIHVQVHTGVGTYRSQKLTSSVVPQEPPILSFETGSHQTGAHQGGQAVWPASPRNLPASPFPGLELWAHDTTPRLFFKTWVLGRELRPSCLPIKDFTSWAISPSLFVLNLTVVSIPLWA